MVHAQTLHLVQRKQDSCKEQLVFFLERESETVDDTSENLEKFCNTVETFGFVDKLEEHVIDRPPNVGAQIQEFTVNPVQCRLEKVAFSGVFGIKQLKKLALVLV